MVQRINKATLSENIVGQLTDMIVSGQLQTGERLPSEKELMEMFGVGRTSLREALRTLTVMGLVEGRRGQGTFVRSDVSEFFHGPPSWSAVLGVRELAELCQAREIVEVGLTGVAAARLSEQDKRDLREILKKMAMSTKRPRVFREADLQFHIRLAEASGNQVLLRFVKTVRSLIAPLADKSLSQVYRPTEALEEHALIMKYLDSGDVAASCDAMARHIRRSAEVLLSVGREEALR